MAGDGWSRRPPRDPEVQLAVMRRDVAELIANGQPLTLFGDNFFVELDISAAKPVRRPMMRAPICVVLAGLALADALGSTCFAATGAAAPEAGWHVYQDAAYGFSIAYPDDYVILPESAMPPDLDPRPLHRVRFQDRELASSETAALEPPRFEIEVFAGAGSVPLRQWLRSTGRVPEAATIEPVTLEGALEGLRVSLVVLIAPRERCYFAGKRHVYALTPLGPHGPAMLASFRLLPPETGSPGR